MSTLPPGVKPYERRKFTKTRRQILNAIPPSGIEEVELAIKLGVSLVELRHALKLMAKENLVHAHCTDHWDGISLNEQSIWRIKP